MNDYATYHLCIYIDMLAEGIGGLTFYKLIQYICSEKNELPGEASPLDPPCQGSALELLGAFSDPSQKQLVLIILHYSGYVPPTVLSWLVHIFFLYIVYYTNSQIFFNLSWILFCFIRGKFFELSLPYRNYVIFLILQNEKYNNYIQSLLALHQKCTMPKIKQ